MDRKPSISGRRKSADGSQTPDLQKPPPPPTAKERALNLTPTDVYWDPRYNKYFYSGFIQTEGGTIAEAIVPVIEVHPPSADSTVRRTILMQSQRQGPPRSDRRIAWTEEPLVRSFGHTHWTTPVASAPPPGLVPLVEPGVGEQTGKWSRRSLFLAICLSSLLLLLTVLLTLWIWKFLDQGASESDGDPGRFGALRQTRTEQATPGLLDGDSSSVYNIAYNTEPNDNHAGFETTSTTNPDFLPFPATQELLHLPQHSSSYSPLLRNVCLHTHREKSDTNNADHASPGQGHDNSCDVLVECCAHLGDDMRLTLEDPLLQSHDKAKPLQLELLKKCSASEYSPGALLVMVRSRYSTFRGLLVHGPRATSVFIQDALRLARRNHYAGIRFWLHDFESKVLALPLLNAIRELAARLRKRNCTLGFFLPHPEATQVGYVKRMRLLEGFLNAPQSILLYPAAFGFPNKKALLTSKRIQTAFKSRRSVCYIFHSGVATSTDQEIPTPCDGPTPPSEFRASLLEHGGVTELCRSWNSSSKSPSNCYYSHMCRGNKKRLFQTPVEITRLREEVHSRSGFDCVGTFHGAHNFSGACYTLASLSEESRKFVR